MSTLCPPSFSFLIIFCISVSFPADLVRALPSYIPLGIFGASCLGWGTNQESELQLYRALQENHNSMVHSHSNVLISGSYHGSHREEVGVIAALLEVHHHVEQGYLISTTARVQGLKVTGEDEFVVLPKNRFFLFFLNPQLIPLPQSNYIVQFS